MSDICVNVYRQTLRLTAAAFVQAALTHRITNRARLEEVARQVVANSTDKLLEVGLDERMVCQTACILFTALLTAFSPWDNILHANTLKFW